MKNRNTPKAAGQFRENPIDVARRLHADGDLVAAEKIYRKILRKRPRHPEALHLLGLIKNQQGDNHAALDLMTQSITIKADEPFFYNNLGLVQCAMHQYEEAESAYRQALKLNAQLPSVIANLATLSLIRGDPSSAVNYCRQALHIQPDFEAVNILLGDTLRAISQHQESLSCYEQVLSVNSESSGAYIGKGNTLMGLGEYKNAVEAFRKALKIQPKAVSAYSGLAMCSAKLGDGALAVSSYRAAIRLEPGNLALHQNYATFLKNVKTTTSEEELENDLLQLLGTEGIEQQDLVSCATSALLNRTDFKITTDRLLNGSYTDDQNISELECDVKTLCHPVLLSIMKRSILTCPELEHVLTKLRKQLLYCIQSKDAKISSPEKMLIFLCAFAQQCWVNDHVYYVSENELPLVEQLISNIRQQLDVSGSSTAIKLALLATYKPLYSCFSSVELASYQLPFLLIDFESLIKKHVKEPEAEAEIVKNIPSLTEIFDGTSSAVREQYEACPYPRWENIPATPPVPFGGYIIQSLRTHQLKVDTVPSAPEVLVAGCGTGRHAILVAQHIYGSKVLAIDLSLRSLAYAIRKTQDLKINNIEFAHADILALGNLGREFDLIECAGVLHHLLEPLDGWRVLLGLLKTGGYMRVALYSEIARREVVQARTLIKERGYGSSNDEIRRFRHDLYEMAETETVRQVISKFRDFHSINECRDLLFHVQEHRYTVPRLQKELQLLDLEFLGFEMPELNTLDKYRNQFPEDPEAMNLDNWHTFEKANPDIFKSMYTFWVQKR